MFVSAKLIAVFISSYVCHEPTVVVVVQQLLPSCVGEVLVILSQLLASEIDLNATLTLMLATVCAGTIPQAILVCVLNTSSLAPPLLYGLISIVTLICPGLQYG